MYRETVVGNLKSGAAIAYRVKDGDALYSIYIKGGGQVPSVLSGFWNDTRQIENAINSYINKDKLCKQDQDKKDFRANVNAAKRRPNKLKQKKKA
mgnify:CR=1 FL=1